MPSTNKLESYIGIGDNFTYICSYDSVNNETAIKIKSYIQNKTIYAIDKVTIKVNLYNNDTLVMKEEKFIFNFEVKQGTTKDFDFNIYYLDGVVNKLEYVSWSANYKTIWNSYKPWFISTIIISFIIAIAIILIMIIENFDFDDLFDFFEEHLGILPTILIVFIPYFIDGVLSGSWSWIPPIILSGGILLLVSICLIAFGIKYLFTDIIV